MRARFGSSLKTRIAATVGLLFALGLGLITYYSVTMLHREMDQVISAQQLAAASYVARDIDAKIKLRLDGLLRVAGNLPADLVRHPPKLQEWLDQRRAIHALFPTGLIVIPADGGAPLADSPHLDSRPKSFVDRDWFQETVATRQPVVSKPLITRATGEPALVIAIPIYDERGELNVVLAGITPLATPGFLDLIRDMRLGLHGSYQLVSPKHRLIALTSLPEEPLALARASGTDTVVEAAIGGARGIQVIRGPAGEEEVAAIVDIPQSGWLLISRQPTQEVFEPAVRALKQLLMVAILLALPVIGLLMVALNRMLQPLASLADEISDMAEGGRSMQPIAAGSSSAEIANVALSFNRLQGRLQEQERRLTEMAQFDNLTGLPNRRLLEERLASEVLRVRRSRAGIALLFLDLDGFKAVNDRHGHQVGDQLLIEVARRLQQCVRDVDTVARLGGDEFLILLSESTNPRDAAARVAQACIDALAAPLSIQEHQVSIGVSIGIAYAEDGATEGLMAERLVGMADLAMYSAKAAGRNRYCFQEEAVPEASPLNLSDLMPRQ